MLHISYQNSKAVITEVDEEGEDYEEEIEFDHLCANCNHKIAHHLYSFTVWYSEIDGMLIIEKFLVLLQDFSRFHIIL